MVRFLLYVLLFYFLWKCVRVFSTRRRYRREDSAEPETPKAARPDFSNIKDAEFEDLPPAPPSDPGPPTS